MTAANVKRNIFRGLLLFHFLGLATAIGTRLADLYIDRETAQEGLQALSFGRDLTSSLAIHVVLPGFLLTVATGIAMTISRYGLHPPFWVWIKISLNTVTLFVATLLVAPALAAAREWAHWSLAHNDLAPQFQSSATEAGFYGAVVFALFLLNIPVAIWKPLAAIRLPALSSGNLRAKGSS